MDEQSSQKLRCGALVRNARWEPNLCNPAEIHWRSWKDERNRKDRERKTRKRTAAEAALTDSEAAAPAAAAAAASAAVPPPAAVGCFYGGRGKKPFSNSVFLFFNSFPHLMQAAFFSHQAAFLYERKHVCCVAGPCEAALSRKIKVAHIFEGVFD